MKLPRPHAIKMAIAALIHDNERGDGEFTCVQELGLSLQSSIVYGAAMALKSAHDNREDVYEVFADCLKKYADHMKAGGSVALEDQMVKVGRNDPCICGSGKKFKRCCYSVVAWPTKAKTTKGKPN